MLKIRDYVEISVIAQELMSSSGLGYKEALEEAKIIILRNRAGDEKVEKVYQEELRRY